MVEQQLSRMQFYSYIPSSNTEARQTRPLANVPTCGRSAKMATPATGTEPIDTTIARGNETSVDLDVLLPLPKPQSSPEKADSDEYTTPSQIPTSPRWYTSDLTFSTSSSPVPWRLQSPIQKEDVMPMPLSAHPMSSPGFQDTVLSDRLTVWDHTRSSSSLHGPARHFSSEEHGKFAQTVISCQPWVYKPSSPDKHAMQGVAPIGLPFDPHLLQDILEDVLRMRKACHDSIPMLCQKDGSSDELVSALYKATCMS